MNIEVLGASMEVPQQPGRELPSVDQGPGTGDETLRLAWAGPTVADCVRQHPTALWAPSSSDQRARMANRDDQPLRGLEPDHYRRSGLKDAVSHHLSPAGPLTSIAPQAFPNNLTMPLRPDRPPQAPLSRWTPTALRRRGLQGPQRHRTRLQHRQAMARTSDPLRLAVVYRGAAVLRAITVWATHLSDTP